MAIAAVAAQTTGYAAHILLFDRSVVLLDADSDRSVGMWMSATATALSIPGLVVLAMLSQPHRARIVVLAGLVGYLSLDDAVALHEHIADKEVELGLGAQGRRIVWPLAYLPVRGATTMMLLDVARRAPSGIAGWRSGVWCCSASAWA